MRKKVIVNFFKFAGEVVEVRLQSHNSTTIRGFLS
ncbi:hypothetical protein Lser_V15G32971 [Lactuca serriola]